MAARLSGLSRRGSWLRSTDFAFKVQWRQNCEFALVYLKLPSDRIAGLGYLQLRIPGFSQLAIENIFEKL